MAPNGIPFRHQQNRTGLVVHLIQQVFHVCELSNTFWHWSWLNNHRKLFVSKQNVYDLTVCCQHLSFGDLDEHL